MFKKWFKELGEEKKEFEEQTESEGLGMNLPTASRPHQWSLRMLQQATVLILRRVAS